MMGKFRSSYKKDLRWAEPTEAMASLESEDRFVGFRLFNKFYEVPEGHMLSRCAFWQFCEWFLRSPMFTMEFATQRESCCNLGRCFVFVSVFMFLACQGLLRAVGVRALRCVLMRLTTKAKLARGGRLIVMRTVSLRYPAKTQILRCLLCYISGTT